jgi:guanyl-specific ribonuclease Sa
VALLVLVAALLVGYAVKALDSGTHDRPAPPVSTVSLSSLPVQVAATVTLIKRGGPFPYPRNDGAVFHNNEHLLPSEPDGYYHEYTVPTPHSTDRGARRMITGEDGRYWYTGDHYESFDLVDVSG